MEVDYRYEHVTGVSAKSYFTLGVRYDAEYDHHSSRESWCVHLSADRLSTSLGNAAYYTGIWCSPEGEVFVAEALGTVFRNSDPVRDPDGWIADVPEAGVALSGLWGLRSDYVLAWGGPAERLFLWNGSAWSAMPHPGGWIRAIHGESSDLLFAVGSEGLISRWDGVKWTRVPYPDITLRTVVSVGDGDQVYCGGPGGELLEGSEHGVSKLLHHEAPILALAWWRDELWVGAGNGLHKLVDGALEMVKDNILAHAFDARGDLLMGTDAFTAHTADGAAFTAYFPKSFGALRAGHTALWAPDLPIDIDHGRP